MSPGRFGHFSCCLLALMLVIVRVADAHAHLCADGKEPPVTIHLGDGGVHPCDDGQSNDHAGDKNVQIGSDGLLKKASPLADPLMPAVIAVAFDFAARPSNEVILVAPLTVRVEALAYIRPPLRGPPV